MQIPAVYSLLLSQILGAFLFIMAMIMLGRPAFYRQMLSNLKLHEGLVVLGGAFSLFVGIVLVSTHNVWVLSPRVTITIFCWLLLLNGIFWLAMPERMITIVNRVCSSRKYYGVLIFLALFGLFMLVRGMELYIVHYFEHASGAAISKSESVKQ